MQKKSISKVIALVIILAMASAFLAACGGSAPADAVTGTWKQTDATNGDWTWTFGGGKCKLVGDTTGFESEGTYVLDEKAGTLTGDMKKWDDKREFTYKVDGDKLDLESKYSSYHLVKQK